jgi:hypothetical protein
MVFRKLENNEIEIWRSCLEVELPPDEMERLVDEIKSTIGEYFHVQSGLTFVREAWVACRFAQARGADLVRLLRIDPPDCELIFKDRRERFEIVEAIELERRRSDEYNRDIKRRERGEEPLFENDNLDDLEGKAKTMLEYAATKKASKKYCNNADFGLIIYLNLGDYGFATEEIEAGMQVWTTSAKDAFREIWVIWKEVVYQLWQDGTPLPKLRYPVIDTKNIDSLTNASKQTL